MQNLSDIGYLLLKPVGNGSREELFNDLDRHRETILRHLGTELDDWKASTAAGRFLQLEAACNEVGIEVLPIATVANEVVARNTLNIRIWATFAKLTHAKYNAGKFIEALT